MRVIVTRPAAQASDWVAHLRASAIDAVALPLIDIAPATDGSPLHAVWHGLAQRDLVVFVSPNAVEQFFAARPAGAAWPARVQAGSPGPGTSRVLIGLGVPAASIVEPADDAAQFDSESLWARLSVQPWQGRRVTIVRGDGGRDWLAQTLRDAGAQVEHVAAYRRVAPHFGAAETALLRSALERPASHLWFFSSSEAIDNLVASPIAGAAPADWSQARALATHPRIAARARQWGFARVTETRPAMAAVIACIQSIRP